MTDKDKKKLFITSKRNIFIISCIASLLIPSIVMYSYYSSAASKSTMIANMAKRYANMGIKEIPSKSNRGNVIDEFNKIGGCSVGSPWCASFVSQMIIYAGGDGRLRSCSTVTLKNLYAKYHRVLSFSGRGGSLISGDVLFRERPAGKGHVGIFAGYGSANGKKFMWVIEGNTSCAANDTNGCLKYRRYWLDGTRADYNTTAGEEGTYLWTSILRY